MAKEKTWLEKAWYESKRLMLQKFIKEILNEVGNGGSIHIIIAPGGICECGEDNGHCESIIAERISKLEEVEKIL